MAATFSIENLPKFVRTTAAKYAALAVKDPNALYYITDRNHFFLGGRTYSLRLEKVSSKPSAAGAEQGILYYNTASQETYVFDGTTVLTLGGSAEALANKVDKITGDVADGDIVLASGTTGIGVKTSGVGIRTSGDLSDADTSMVPVGSIVKTYVDDKIAAIGTAVNIKGTVASYDDLPASGNRPGDLWIVSSDGSEWLYTETSGAGAWERIGPVLDLDGYMEKVPSAQRVAGNIVVQTAAGGVAGFAAAPQTSGDLASDATKLPAANVVHAAISDGLGQLAWTSL